MRSRAPFSSGVAQSYLVATAVVALLIVNPIPASDNLHETIKSENGRYSIRAEDGPSEITDISGYCGECHSEEVAGFDPASAAKAPSHEFGGTGTSHPVEVEYPVERRGYRPRNDLDPALELTDGRMTCLTCHSPDANRGLVLPKGQSRLCVACHAK